MDFDVFGGALDTPEQKNELPLVSNHSEGIDPNCNYKGLGRIIEGGAFSFSIWADRPFGPVGLQKSTVDPGR